MDADVIPVRMVLSGNGEPRLHGDDVYDYGF